MMKTAKGEIEYDKLGQIACCSTYHFQRMFTYIAGMPLSEYIRRRKMSLAAVDLQGGQAKIIDVAAKYGYTSPTAFNSCLLYTSNPRKKWKKLAFLLISMKHLRN